MLTQIKHFSGSITPKPILSFILLTSTIFQTYIIPLWSLLQKYFTTILQSKKNHKTILIPLSGNVHREIVWVTCINFSSLVLRALRKVRLVKAKCVYTSTSPHTKSNRSRRRRGGWRGDYAVSVSSDWHRSIFYINCSTDRFGLQKVNSNLPWLGVALKPIIRPVLKLNSF